MEKDQYLNVSRPNKVCLLCGRSLKEVQKHPSILTKWENEAIRKDFCPECWEKMKDRDYFSYWVTKRITSAPKRQLTKKERNDLLLRLFESLYRQQEKQNSYSLFFLAHLLMRYKIFHWKGSRNLPEDLDAGTPERTLLIFENRYTGEEIEITDQELDGEKILNTRTEIDEYLTTNLPEETEEETE